ncbi:hypothetical protein KFL_003310070 [Klebsormidium nitens]|uniref:Uncharacterized protein n=1 Tax=Klebsormidium nitens TaxID=105231 RepID=A0A1Y1I7Z9_KLENI|nr:hypothetical protein KFL_003310070 [Klebsormidium nitens]|eukprot:GAQ87095.1 hypothetical protein KFL_003310070 [Klebsormidium nitens]
MGLLARIISSPRAGLARTKTPQNERVSSSPTSPVGSTGSPLFRQNLPPALQTKRDEVVSKMGLGGVWAVVGDLVRLCDESETCALKSTVKAAMDVGQRCVRLQAPLLGHLEDLERLQHHEEVRSALGKLEKTVAQSRELLGRLSGRASSFSPRWLHTRTLKRILQEAEGAVGKVETALATVSYRQQLDHVLSHPTDELASQNRPAISGRSMAESEGNGIESDGRPSSRTQKQSPSRHDKIGSVSRKGESGIGKSSPAHNRDTNRMDIPDGTRVRQQKDGAEPSASFKQTGALENRESYGNGAREVESADRLLEAALEAEARGDFAGAAGLYQRSAGQGSAEAAAALGFSLEHGRGIPRDDLEAVHWYGQAARAGHPQAQNNLGKMYFDGRGVPRNQIEAVGWFLKSAAQGSASALNNLGICYEDGLGVTADVALAAQFYRQAALRGHSMAIVNLAHVCSRTGPSDEAQSLLDTAAKRRLTEMLPEVAPGRLRSFAEERGSRPRAEQPRFTTAAATDQRASERNTTGSEVQPFEGDSDTESDTEEDAKSCTLGQSENDILREIMRPSTAGHKLGIRESKPPNTSGSLAWRNVQTGGGKNDRLSRGSGIMPGGPVLSARRASFPISRSDVELGAKPVGSRESTGGMLKDVAGGVPLSMEAHEEEQRTDAPGRPSSLGPRERGNGGERGNVGIRTRSLPASRMNEPDRIQEPNRRGDSGDQSVSLRSASKWQERGLGGSVGKMSARSREEEDAPGRGSTGPAPVREYSTSRLASRAAAASRPTAATLSTIQTRPGILGVSQTSRDLARLTSELSVRSPPGSTIAYSPPRGAAYSVQGGRPLGRGLSFPLSPNPVRMSAASVQRPPQARDWQVSRGPVLERLSSDSTGLLSGGGYSRSSSARTDYRGAALLKTGSLSPRERGVLREWTRAGSLGESRRPYF